MGFFSRLFGTTAAVEAPGLETESSYSKPGSDPERANAMPSMPLPPYEVVATEPWAQKLVNYASRVSAELKQSHLQTWPGENFWVIAADVHEATWHVPVRNKFSLQQGWMREGSCYGKALLLLTDGRLLQAEFFGHFNFNEPCLSFTYEHSNADFWRTTTWGANNFASWRDKPGGGFGRTSGAQRQEFWDGRWNHRGIDEKPPGLGTSLALKRFLETHKTQLPKYY